MSRPGLAHPFAELARIGAVAAPTLAGLATTAGLVLAALAHALLDLVLGALVALVARHDISSRDPGGPSASVTAQPGRSARVPLSLIQFVRVTPWCTDQRGGRTDPSSRPGSRDADGLRASE